MHRMLIVLRNSRFDNEVKGAVSWLNGTFGPAHIQLQLARRNGEQVREVPQRARVEGNGAQQGPEGRRARGSA